MLTLTIREGEGVRMGDVVVLVGRVTNGQVRLTFGGLPADVPVVRSEVDEQPGAVHEPAAADAYERAKRLGRARKLRKRLTGRRVEK